MIRRALYAVAGALSLFVPAIASATVDPPALRVSDAPGAGGGLASAAAESALAPTSLLGWAGIRDPSAAPADATGAVGDTRFIALMNRKFAIYDKSSPDPIRTGTLNQFAGVPAANGSFHPQVIWDPQTSRFYYLMATVVSPTDNRLAFGFSTTPNPSSAADFCHYQIEGYGDQLPDYPKLGDSRYFLLFGVNAFHADFGFIRGDLLAVSKPPGGTACPQPTSLGLTFEPDLLNPNGTQAFTPVPVNSIDTIDAGWVISTPKARPASSLSLFRVTRNPDGTAAVQNPGASPSVPSYDVPADAPQKNTANLLDTLDGRLTQAVSAVDPSQGGKQALWTQHTVAGGAGAEVRWYELNLSGSGMLQSGKVSNPSIYNFNAAISPDRAVHLPTKQFGDSMVMGYTSSSPTLFPQVRMVSKLGPAPQSSAVAVKSSGTFYRGLECSGGLCRWGEYAGATPDPLPASGPSRVWLVNQLAFNPDSPTAAGWKPWNWSAVP
jgi:hypothetical protein